jgi:hypothetical protein
MKIEEIAGLYKAMGKALIETERKASALTKSYADLRARVESIEELRRATCETATVHHLRGRKDG